MMDFESCVGQDSWTRTVDMFVDTLSMDQLSIWYQTHYDLLQPDPAYIHSRSRGVEKQYKKVRTKIIDPIWRDIDLYEQLSFVQK